MSTKNAFTMIEMIFVIVILGILSAVAVPKMIATRDDAVNAKILHSISSGLSQIGAYAIAHEDTVSDLAVMSSSLQDMVNEGNAITDPANELIRIKRGSVSDCLLLQITRDTSENNISLSKGNAQNDHLCQSLQAIVNERDYVMKLRGGLLVN